MQWTFIIYISTLLLNDGHASEAKNVNKDHPRNISRINIKAALQIFENGITFLLSTRIDNTVIFRLMC